MKKIFLLFFLASCSALFSGDDTARLSEIGRVLAVAALSGPGDRVPHIDKSRLGRDRDDARALLAVARCIMCAGKDFDVEPVLPSKRKAVSQTVLPLYYRNRKRFRRFIPVYGLKGGVPTDVVCGWTSVKTLYPWHTRQVWRSKL